LKIGSHEECFLLLLQTKFKKSPSECKKSIKIIYWKKNIDTILITSAPLHKGKKNKNIP
jgi:hypothetical protein